MLNLLLTYILIYLLTYLFSVTNGLLAVVEREIFILKSVSSFTIHVLHTATTVAVQVIITSVTCCIRVKQCHATVINHKFERDICLLRSKTLFLR